ncbi:MAG: hypothetical protein ACFE8M_01770 [Candidatus Hermodarchaeota archaeon]
MRTIAKGIIFLSFGIYLAVINTVLSILFNKVYYLHYIPTDPLTYWMDWLKIYGLYTFIFASLGVYFVIISFRYFKKKDLTKIASNATTTI